ncbi:MULTISPECIES: hypothetical protein [Rhodococcus]|uniref:Uncharacterized protein n=2 Tax=Nocardiaceae TaxID=85025 RepID=A0A652YWT2_NOCGL|nr:MULTISPECIES: hypothetical protein [Rhodococcus]MDV6268114.1 hypothetical protein [Rhodococcus globerulus]MDV8069932.1 hypothetical protein [Rhodococcus sp. IEGM 1366]PVX64325.1 hypothetical protein C8E04_1598 [Rhodococcus globerulus]
MASADSAPVTTSKKVRPPTAVNAAFWLWIASAFLLILFGLISMSSASYELREQFADQGVSADNIDTYVTFVRVSGVALLLSGLIIGGLAGPTRLGRRLCRRILVIYSGVFVWLQLALVITGISTALALVVPVMLISAGVSIYRGSTRSWFAHG